MLSAIVAGSVMLAFAIVASIVNDLLAEVGTVAAVVRMLGIALVTFGLVAAGVRLGFLLSRCTGTKLWVPIAIPFVSVLLLWLMPNPFDALRFVSMELWQRFAMSHPSKLDSLIIHLVVCAAVFLVLLGVSYAFGYLSMNTPVQPNKSLERTRGR
jgi:hypothetical protein